VHKHALRLCVFFAISSAIAFSQVIACSNMVGDWVNSFTWDEYYLSQDAKGNLSGWMASGPCSAPTDWPITGTISGGVATFTATNNACSLSTAAWVKFTGTVGEPGCNFVHGTYTNSNGGSGAWGDSNPYPTVDDYVTKAVDVPTSETSTTPPPAAWNTTHGAPWNQTFAPNSPAGEFEARGVYEYAGTGAWQRYLLVLRIQVRGLRHNINTGLRLVRN
jgi:hypothetical protein